MTAINFVARSGAVQVNRGEIPDDQGATPIRAGGGQETSLNFRQSEIGSYEHVGQNL